MTGKTILLIIAIVATAAVFNSCGDNGTGPDQPILSVSPRSLDFSTNLVELNFFITNGGDGVLDWSINNADESWGTAAPASGTTSTETDTVTVTVDRGSLSGDFTDTLVISSNGGDAEVVISVQVPTAPTLAVSPTLLDFGTQLDTLEFYIINSGPGTLQWSIADSMQWLAVNPASGTTSTETDTISVTVYRPYLSSDTLAGTIEISSNGGSVSVDIIARDTVLTGGGVYAVFIVERTIELHPQMGARRNDFFTARFDSAFAPCAPETPLMADSVSCNGLALEWDDSSGTYSYSQMMPRTFIDLGGNYVFNISGNSVVPPLADSIIFPAYDPYITMPSNDDTVSINSDLNITWAETGGGTVFISLIHIADSSCAVPGDSSSIDGVFAAADNTGSHTISSSSLNGLGPGEYLLILNQFDIDNLSAEGYDSRSIILAKTTSKVSLYLE